MEPQQKPTKRGNYRQRVMSGEQAPWRSSSKQKPMKRGSHIRPVAKKKIARNDVYRKWAAERLANETRCQRCGTSSEGLEPHHPFGRGKDHLFAVVAICRSCHEWVHAEPSEALKQGWLQPEYRGVARSGKMVRPWSEMLEPPESEAFKASIMANGEISTKLTPTIEEAKLFVAMNLNNNEGAYDSWWIEKGSLCLAQASKEGRS